jgi:hypothetical protein
MFAGKLDFLMKLTDTSNSALGRALGFDPSYISRMRSGKRGLPRDRFFLEPAAAYFAHELQENPLRRNTAAEAVCPGMGWPETEAEGEKLLLSWLGQTGKQDMERVEMLLHGLAAARLLWPEAREVPSGAPVIRPTIYYGTEGKREAILRLISDYCASEDPRELLFFSNETIWAEEGDAFAARLSEGLLRLIRRGARIRIIQTVNHERGELLDSLRKWIRLYLSGSLESYYCPRPSNDIFRGTLIVAQGHGALSSSSANGQSGPSFLTSVPAAVEAMAEEFNAYLSLCVPLIQAYHTDRREEVWDLLRNFEAAHSSRITSQWLPLGCSLPEEVIVAFSRRGGPKLAPFLRDAARDMEQQLKEGLSLTEIIHLPSLEDIRAGNIRPPINDYLGIELRYTTEELKLHLAQVAAHLRKWDNYHVVLSSRVPKGVMLYAKEDVGCFFVRLSAPPTLFYVSEQRLAAAFWDYLQYNAALGQSRELVIRHLEEYSALL